MSNETLETYVREERARGVADEDLRKEIASQGWGNEDIDYAMANRPNETEIEKSARRWPFFGTTREAMLRILCVGFAFFLVSSAMYFAVGENLRDSNEGIVRFVFMLFLITHIINATSATLLFRFVWKLSRSVWFRLWIGTMAFIVSLFAVLSSLHFFTIATQTESIFNTLVNMFYGYDGNGLFLLFVYFVLVPLQSVVFFLLAITLWALRFLRKRSGGIIPSLRIEFWTTGLFLFMALLALGDVYMIISNG